MLQTSEHNHSEMFSQLIDQCDISDLKTMSSKHRHSQPAILKAAKSDVSHIDLKGQFPPKMKMCFVLMTYELKCNGCNM